MDAEDFEPEEFGISESIGLAFHGFDFVVGAFQGAGRDGMVVPGQDTEGVEAERLGELLEDADAFEHVFLHRVGQLAVQLSTQIGKLLVVELDDVKPIEDQRVTETSYDPLGHIVSVTSPEGTIHYEYDAVTGALERTYTGSADPGRTSAAADGKAVTDTRYEYDPLGRLTRESYNSYDDDLDLITAYEFDLVGNRLEKASDTAPSSSDFTAFLTSGTLTPDETVTYTYDASDRLLTEAKDATNDRFTVYEYGTENSGTQQTGKTVHQGLSDQGTVVEKTSYQYNLQGRMSKTEIDSDGNTDLESRSEYSYDAEGICVSQTVTTDTDTDGSLEDETPVETKYLNDKQNPTGYSQVLEEKDGSGNVTKTYTLGHEIIAQADDSENVYYLQRWPQETGPRL